MLSISCQNKQKINFGTTERISKLKLGGVGMDGHVCNANYFIRREYSPINEYMEPIIRRANEAKTVEWKVWGCSDLSSFLTKMMSIHKQMGKEAASRKFDNIELIDIDSQIVARAKKKLIGLSGFDKDNIQDEIGVDPKQYFSPCESSEDFFLPGEPTRVNGIDERGMREFVEQNPRARNIPECFFSYKFQAERPIVPHRISDDLLKGVTIRQGDIREDIRKLPANKKEGNLRIFDFSNAWYFLKLKDQVKLACDLSRKTQEDDILIVGGVEIARGLKYLLTDVGFSPYSDMCTFFNKKRPISPVGSFVRKRLPFLYADEIKTT